MDFYVKTKENYYLKGDLYEKISQKLTLRT